MRHLRLVGAGHAHLAVLLHLKKQRLAKQWPNNTEVSLICAERYQRYSGMLPAWMAGHATEAEMSIDIAPLCAAAGVTWIQDDLVSMQATQGHLSTAHHPALHYDVLSLNTGAQTKLSGLLSGIDALDTALLPIRPLSNFIPEWQAILKQAQQQPSYQLIIVGAGAAAVELAMAAQVALRRINSQHQVTLVCGQRLLPDFSPAQVARITRQLQQQQVNIVYTRAGASDSKSLATISSNVNTNGLNTTTLHCTNGQQISADRVIMATGTAAPEWTRASQLACDQDGFIQVGATHQSTSHPNVFAVGDICQRVDQPVAHSGVHAVHAGAVLADNLLAYLAGTALRPYPPKARSLYLLSCGTPYAVACWGRYYFEGAWVWRLKQQIDHRFVRRYQF